MKAVFHTVCVRILDILGGKLGKEQYTVIFRTAGVEGKLFTPLEIISVEKQH